MAGVCRRDSARYVALAVGSTTLPHYRGLEAHAEVLAPKILMPVDELWPAPDDVTRAFGTRLRVALPPHMQARYSPIRVRGDVEAEVVRIERDLEGLGLAVAVLGLGPDGHVAMNQPGSGIESRTRVVEIQPRNLERLGDVGPATHALTLGVATLLEARALVLVVDGDGKHDALERVLEGPEGSDVPASLLRGHPHLTLLVRDSA